MKAGRNGTWKNTPFSTKVKKKLVDRNMTMVQLAKVLGKSQSYVSQVIYGVKNDSVCISRIMEVLEIKNGNKAFGK